MIVIDTEPVKAKLNEILGRIRSESGAVIGQSVRDSVRDHFRWIYPGSQHYDPNKVNVSSSTGSSATIEVAVPGVTRAYGEVDIRPKNSEWLTIPIHPDSRGRSARSFTGLFGVTTGKGTRLLAQRSGSGIRFLYVLKKSVRQNRDSGLMPTDEQMADAAFTGLVEKLHL